MSLLDKIRSSLPIPRRSFHHPEPASVLMGYVLLDRSPVAQELAALAGGIPGAVVSHGPAPEDPLEIALGDINVIVSSVPQRVPGGEAEDSAANNTFWPDAAATVARHEAHLVVTAMHAPGISAGEESAQHIFKAFVQAAAALLKHEAATGIYLGDQGIVYEKSFYVDAVAAARDALPWQVAWLTWAAWESPGLSCGSTRGLRVFGHEELEVRGSTAEPSAVMDLLSTVAGYIVESGAVLHPGETLEYAADQRLTITAVGGSFVDGHALRIGLP